MFSLFRKNKGEKSNLRPVRSLFWVGAFLFLFSFVILLPIYKNANMTESQHLQEGLLALSQQNYSKARAHLLQAAQNKNAQAFYILGKMEMEGKNAEDKANPTQEAGYFENAANLGLKDAQYILALLYDRGEGVAQSKEKALDWGLLAAAQGDINATYAAAVWLERGYSGKAEPHLALTLYEYAAEKGHQNAMATLISIYSGGTEIPVNIDRANYWKNQLKTAKAKAEKKTK